MGESGWWASVQWLEKYREDDQPVGERALVGLRQVQETSERGSARRTLVVMVAVEKKNRKRRPKLERRRVAQRKKEKIGGHVAPGQCQEMSTT